MDKATIVSFFPREFDETTPSMRPPSYHIPASDGKTPQLLVIGKGISYLENWVGDNKQVIPIYHEADEIANALCIDFRNSMIGIDEDCYPAVFWLPGEVTESEVMKGHKAKVEQALRCQVNWMKSLIKKADDIWEKHHQHSAIGTMERVSAKLLALDRPWLSLEAELTRCPACNASVSVSQAVCGSCRCVINPEAYKKLQFATMG